MKILKKFLLLAFIALLIFIAHVFISTGYFRTIENKFDGELAKKIELAGAEDITVSLTDDFALISATDRKKLPSIEEEFGGLYYLDLKTGNYTIKKLTKDFKKPFAPHGISMLKTDSTYKIIAVNHTPNGHTLEVFSLKDEALTFEQTLSHESMISPNDIVMIDENRFYFTNDHKYTHGLGRLFEDYAGLAISNVIYFDGENYSEVAKGIAYSNGINYDSKRKLLFVASPRKFLVKVFSKNDDGSLNFIEDIDCGTGVDNIEFDSDDNLWIGAHPNLLRFASYAKGKKEISPSEIIKINYKGKNEYTIKKMYINDGGAMSASTVAAPYKDLIITGNVMDSHFLILKRDH